MTLFETQSGRGIEIALPRSDWEELNEVAQALTDLRKERRVTMSRLSSLQGERERAITKDRDALAQAIRDGKADPGDKSVEKVEKEIAACNRRIEALEVALEDTERDLIDVIDEHREEWAAEVEASLDEVRSAYEDAVDALALAYEKVASTHSLLYWVRNFPEEMSFRVRTGHVENLKAAHGGAYMFMEVIEALRSDAQRRPQIERFVSATQARHEEKARNERAGKGYFTDRELMRREENLVEFDHGVGARKIEPQRIR